MKDGVKLSTQDSRRSTTEEGCKPYDQKDAHEVLLVARGAGDKIQKALKSPAAKKAIGFIRKLFKLVLSLRKIVETFVWLLDLLRKCH